MFDKSFEVLNELISKSCKIKNLSVCLDYCGCATLTMEFSDGTTETFEYAVDENHLTLSSDGFEEIFNRLGIGYFG